MRRANQVIMAMALLVGAQPAWAMRTRAHEMAESPQYGQKAGGMIGRGVINAVTCFVDPLVHIVNETKAGPPLVGTLTGIGSGLGCGVLRLGSGAVDIVTFWVPGFNGFPVSDSYENCVGTGATASAAPAQEMPAYNPPAGNWETPSAEPGAAQAPAPVQESAPKPKKRWTK